MYIPYCCVVWYVHTVLCDLICYVHTVLCGLICYVHTVLCGLICYVHTVLCGLICYVHTVLCGLICYFSHTWWYPDRSQWPRGLRSGSAAARLLGLRVRIPPGACMLWVFYVVRYRPVRRADHSSRGLLPTVVRRCVGSRNLVNEEAMTHWGAVAQKKMMSRRPKHAVCNIRVGTHL